MQKWPKQDGRFLPFSEAIKNGPLTDTTHTKSIENAFFLFFPLHSLIENEDVMSETNYFNLTNYCAAE